MEKARSKSKIYRACRFCRLEIVKSWIQQRCSAILDNLQKNRLWQRMFKNTLAIVITIILAFIPAIYRVYGKTMYLGCMTAVFGHPGRRFGQMAEALVLTVIGVLLGAAWSAFGLYLSGLVYDSNVALSFAIKGIFLALAILFHGFLRSHTPRLFIFVLVFAIVTVVSFTSTATELYTSAITSLLYPILTTCAVLIIVNIFIFPEFSSTFIGEKTIVTLIQTADVLRDAGRYFASNLGETQLTSQKGQALGAEAAYQEAPLASESPENMLQKLVALTSSKASLRSSLASCKLAQEECNFELAWSVLEPQALKPISCKSMKDLVANVIALIGACESKFACIRAGSAESAGASLDHSTGQSRELPKWNTDEKDSHSHKAHPALRNQSTNTDQGRTSRWRVSRSSSMTDFDANATDLAMVKPQKEIEFGDLKLLQLLLESIAKPVTELQANIESSIEMIATGLAYGYGVCKLPSGAPVPKGMHLEEVDLRVDLFSDAIAAFEEKTMAALEATAAIHDGGSTTVDLMPRMEIFLVSSFLLNFRQAAAHVLKMLTVTRIIIETRQTRHGHRRLYVPRINWRKWLTSAGEQDLDIMPDGAKQDVRTGKREHGADEKTDDILTNARISKSKHENSLSNHKDDQMRSGNTPAVSSHAHRSINTVLRLRLADCLEYFSDNEDVYFAIKLAIAVLLVTWPALIAAWNKWFSLNRGVWAALQLIFVTEVSIGTSVWTFILRLFGTTIGCTWGWAAYEAGNGNPYICTGMLAIGIVPCTYVQLGSQYVKAGMVAIISMCIVALATVDESVPGTATENYISRLLAFFIGGVVALLIQIIVFPVKARDRLVESLASSLVQLTNMQACLAHGIESEVNIDPDLTSILARFERAKNKAQAALSAAETFLPFCGTEPRIKGDFTQLARIYQEMIYVLHAIVDRMDNIVSLRAEYGSGVLEEINVKIFPYRRNVAGSITIMLYAAHSALTTKLPLPQFLPSARLAHLRLINRVRELAIQPGDGLATNTADHGSTSYDQDINIARRIVQQKYLSWNATSAGSIEVIEFVEELVDLAKLLVGASEFRGGILTRVSYRAYIGNMAGSVATNFGHGGHVRPADAHNYGMKGQQLRHRKTAFSQSSDQHNDVDAAETIEEVAQLVRFHPDVERRLDHQQPKRSQSQDSKGSPD